MTKSPTKAVLQAQLAEANAAYEAAHGALMEVCAERDALHAECEALRAECAAHTTPSRRVQRAGYVAPAWQAQRAEVMAKAKAMAMQSGRSVRAVLA